MRRPPHGVLWRGPLSALLLFFHAPGGAAEEPVCVAGVAGCSAPSGATGGSERNASCLTIGFNPVLLSCGTCQKLGLRLAEASTQTGSLLEECLGCCRPERVVERFTSARLIADASSQDRDQDLHDFIKRKAPLFAGLEVEYHEMAMKPAVELESDDQPGRILRAEVGGWKSEHLVEFFKTRLVESAVGESSERGVAGSWTAEIQTCAGWRLNQLPEVRMFVKEPGHADTYAGLKVNFIPHHNPDLVFFNEHGEEKERLDLGRFNTQQIHDLMKEKGFGRKRARTFRGEIRTCSGWRLNQLPEVRRFIKDEGNADMYVGLRINFVPHHHPYLIMFDDSGEEEKRIDLAEYTFDQLEDLFEVQQGFKKKEAL